MFWKILNVVLLFWLFVTTLYFYQVQDDDDFTWHRFGLVSLITFLMSIFWAWLMYRKMKKRDP
jgi:hypothetical protein